MRAMPIRASEEDVKMKKNVVGHMVAQKESVGKRIRRLDILPFILCILLALVVWLAVYQIHEEEPSLEPPLTEVSLSTEQLL